MLKKNRKTQKRKRKYPHRMNCYLDLGRYMRLKSIKAKHGKSISALLREGCDLVCSRYE